MTAEGVIAVVDANMERALRAVSVERGVDPRGLALVAFGGAGPLHACALADALGMPAVVVPGPGRGAVGGRPAHGAPAAATSSARGRPRTTTTGLASALESLAGEARDPRRRRRLMSTSRRGARLPLRGPEPRAHACRTVADFDAEHRRRNGYARPGDPVEVVALRAVATRPPASPSSPARPPGPPRRDRRVGPAVIAEPDCTIWVPDGWPPDPGAAGALIAPPWRRTAAT